MDLPAGGSSRGLPSAQRPKASERGWTPRTSPSSQPRFRCAQRPKASERGGPSVGTRLFALSGRAQRPKASERGGRQFSQMVSRQESCSTPEGIGAGWTPGSRTATWATGTRAQRPKASERGGLGHELRGCPGFQVLNARRHRSGVDGSGRGFRSCQLAVLNARRHRSGVDPRLGNARVSCDSEVIFMQPPPYVSRVGRPTGAHAVSNGTTVSWRSSSTSRTSTPEHLLPLHRLDRRPQGPNPTPRRVLDRDWRRGSGMRARRRTIPSADCARPRGPHTADRGR